MKKIITNINHQDKVFYIIESGRKLGFHLTNKLSKTFFDYLDEGVLVDFEIGPKVKKIKNRIYYQVAHFNQIISLHP